MASRVKVTFEVADVDAEERLVREYVTPAFDRLREREDARWPSFNRYGNDPAIDAGRVTLVVFGDADAIAGDERPRWEELVEDGLVFEWDAEESPDVDSDGFDERERLRYRLRSVTSRMSLEYFDEFDELPAACGGVDDGDVTIGWDFGVHHLNNQLGYQGNAGEEEIDLLFQCLTGRLHALAIAPGGGVEAADEKIEDLTGELGSTSAELYRRHGDHGL